jgi:hypothetical protein
MIPMSDTFLRAAGEPLSVGIVARAADHGCRTALVDDEGAVGYDALVELACRGAARLLDGRADLEEARVATTSSRSGRPGWPAASPCRCA